ncbi:MAG: fatty acid oxidation complex subunit alpha FadJ [Polyangiaceae bacterium]|nr:fatty acid oxidation complex subunit alpha FadJ [Polyangiaceae bacterium]
MISQVFEKSLTIEKRNDGVAVIRIDVPDEPVNTLQPNFAEEFTAALAEIDADQSVRAVVIASGKPDGFIAGADIKMLKKVQVASEASALSNAGQRALGKLADFSRPVVAAIHGACLGGGLEVALACHGRVGSSHEKTKLGLPEVQLGVLPGLGGTQRLPRLVGIQASLDMMLTGKQIDSRRAKRMGLLDDVVPPAIVVEVAAKLALKMSESGRRGHFRTLHKGFDKAAVVEALLVENPIGRKILFDKAKQQLRRKTHGNYPAPERILEVVRTGLAKGFERGLQAESQAFGDLVVTPEARELMNLFFATNEQKRDSGVDDASVKPAVVHKVGVLGAGLMGAGVAYVTAAQAGLPVRLKDRDDVGLGRGMNYIRGIADERVARRRLSATERDALLATITPTSSYSGFHDAELVIEAVFEDLELKRSVLKQTEENGHPNLIFASNTSSLPIADLAAASRAPERVLGMHYFSPVHKMPLLEIIVTEKTAPWATATAVQIGKKQGKTVIVVNDGPGFYTTRILGPYMNEAAHLLGEGLSIDAIDDALVEWGFPVGPITLIDEVGIDVAEKVGKVLHHAFGERMAAPKTVGRLVAEGRLGRKNQKGFYVYGSKKDKGKRPVDESVYGLIGQPKKLSLPKTIIAQRCAFAFINEAVRCFEEGILRSARDGDIGAVMGLGFPPFRGGPFRYVDAVGPVAIVRQLERFASEYGPRFAPAEFLQRMAREERRFFGASAVSPVKRQPQKSALAGSE